jgi:hypothetical protein
VVVIVTFGIRHGSSFRMCVRGLLPHSFNTASGTSEFIGRRRPTCELDRATTSLNPACQYRPAGAPISVRAIGGFRCSQTRRCIPGKGMTAPLGPFEKTLGSFASNNRV